MSNIVVKCPAKINLTLEILNKREDGFHNIQSVMQTIDLFDILTISVEKSEELEIKLSGTSKEIPYDERNLVYKAVKLFVEQLYPRPYGERVEFQNEERVSEIRVRGQNYKTIYDKATLEKAKNLRKSTTDTEKILWFCLRNRRLNNLKFNRQVPIGNYIADFVCKEQKLIIELDGSGHLKKEQIKHDLKRQQFLESEGYKIVRFFNTDIFNNLDNVLESIYLTVNSPLTPMGRGKNDETQQHKISVHIEKNIPIAAGLAGGSTDAAGTLWGLNKLFDNVLSSEELHALCAKLGSDLNFCLEGGCQLTTSRGEILEKLDFTEFDLSLIKPKNLGISAKEAYTKFSQLEKKPNLDMTTKLIEAIKSGNARIQDFLHNDLEVAVFHDYKDLQTIKHALPTSIMSGSGSTYFILEKNIANINENFWIKTELKSIPYGVYELI